MAATCTTRPPPQSGTHVPAKPWSGSDWARIEWRRALRSVGLAEVSSRSPTSQPTTSWMSSKRSNHDHTDMRDRRFALRDHSVWRHAFLSGLSHIRKGQLALRGQEVPRSAGGDRRSVAPGSETRPGADVEGQIGHGRLPPRRGAAMPGAGAGARPPGALCPVPLRARGVYGQRRERGLATLSKGPSTQSHRSASRPVSRPHHREPRPAGGGVVSLRRGSPPRALRERTACGDIVARRMAPSSPRPAGGMRALDPPGREALAGFARLLLKKGDAAQAAVEGEIALRLSEGVVTDAAIRYQLVRAYQQNGMPDRAAIHAEIMRAQETPAGNKAKD